MLLCCILRGFGLSQRGYSAWAICWKIQAGIPWRKHMSTRISFLNPWNSKIMWFRSTFSKRPQAFWKGLRPFPGLFEKASGLFGNTTARSQREVSDMSTMIPDEVYGLGMPLLFGFHRKSVSSLRLSDLLCMSTFWKSAKKITNFESWNTHPNFYFLRWFCNSGRIPTPATVRYTLKYPNNHRTFGKINSGR